MAKFYCALVVMALLVAVCSARPAVDDTLEDNDDLETAQQFYNGYGYGGYDNDGYGYQNNDEFFEQRTHIGRDGSIDTETIDIDF